MYPQILKKSWIFCEIQLYLLMCGSTLLVLLKIKFSTSSVKYNSQHVLQYIYGRLGKICIADTKVSQSGLKKRRGPQMHSLAF